MSSGAIRHHFIIAILFFLASGPAVFAWGVGGHKVVALIAFERMSEEARARAIAILEKHPRFQEDFLKYMPAEIAQGSARDRQAWLFAEASVWPDRVRGFKDELQAAYHHSSWHYINLPIFSDARARDAMAGQIAANISGRWSPALDQGRLNAVQALEMISQRLPSPKERDADRAVLLCWAIHLVGDIHQPEHCAALFSPEQFPDLEGGDQGGNLILVRFSRAGSKMTRLHGFWDGLLGQSDTLNGLRRRMFDILRDRESESYAQKALAAAGPMAWANEGAANAKSYVYTPEVLKQISQRTPDSNRAVGPVTLSPEYIEQAGKAAQRFVAAAGYRLAVFLNQRLGP